MEIYNLAKYVHIFSGCVINLINYQNINIPSTISTPIWTTRFATIRFCNFQLVPNQRLKLQYQVVLLDQLTNQTLPKCVPFGSYPIPLRKNVAHPRGWKCLTRFYIYPPDGKWRGILPPLMYEEHFGLNRQMQRYYRTGYHILVQRIFDDVKSWASEMRDSLDENSGLNMLLMFTKDNFITKFQFCCKYCHGCFQVCEDIGKDVTNSVEMEEVASRLNKIGDKTPWCVVGYPKPVNLRNIHFSEISKNDVNIDGILINLVLGSNSSLQFSMYDCPRFLTGAPSQLPEGSTLSFDQCSRDPMIRPKISMKAEVGIQLVTNLRPYGFLSCSMRRFPQTTLENLIHVFSLNVWISVIVSSMFLGLFLLLTSKAGASKVEILTTGYSILLEQNSSIAANLKKETHIYFVSAPWILMSIVITNLIRGDNVQNTISPVRVRPYENFSQLIDNRFTFVDQIVHMRDNEGRRGVGSGHVLTTMRALSTIETSWDVISPRILNHLKNASLFQVVHKKVTNIWYRYPTQITQNGSGFTCAKEKIAYLGWFKQLKETKALLEKHRPGPEYSVGKEYVGLVPTGWIIQNNVDPRIPVRFMALFESGIAKKWLWYDDMVTKLRVRFDQECNTFLVKEASCPANLI
ncbi:hypothetical protein Fcan01_16785 [Folsomia candida]|uniref:Uncharacterized protein n=1 Tax=Folsomia candida TaxID=158441 RepID=A0A226DU09_FOLCA|nr:hypothetical protein Fcan01_16785 [Folsomia candida]